MSQEPFSTDPQHPRPASPGAAPGQGPIDPRTVLRPPGAQGPPHGQWSGPQAPQAGAPPFMPYPPVVIQQGGSGKGWVIGLCLAFLGLSLLVNLLLFIGLAFMGGPEPGEAVTSVVEPGTTAQTVAIVSVDGVILEGTERDFADDLQRAADDANVKAVVVEIDSPGGTVTDSYQMYAALEAFRNDTGKPVVVHLNSVAASGGYMLACAGDEVWAEQTTITGSIGVLLSYPELSGFAEKTGIRFETIVSDGSPHKNLLNTWEKPVDADLDSVRQLLNNQYDLFRGVVEQGRLSAITAAGATLDDVANGKVFIGPQALDLGLVDALGFRGDAINAAAGLAGLSNPHVVRYERSPSLVEVLGLAQADAEAPAIDASRLADPRFREAAVHLLHELSAPRALYLYRGVQ